MDPQWLGIFISTKFLIHFLEEFDFESHPESEIIIQKQLNFVIKDNLKPRMTLNKSLKMKDVRNKFSKIFSQTEKKI